MADFNVRMPSAPDSSGLIGASRGAQAPSAKQTIAKSTGVADTRFDSAATTSLISGVGNLVGPVTQFADTMIKDQIDTEARKVTDQIYSEYGVDDSIVTQAPVDNGPAPVEISKAEKELSRLRQAQLNGTVSEQSYAARLESSVRQLRARFPGHRDYIDQRIANITGMKPANEIVRNLFESASAQSKGAAKEEEQRMQLFERITLAKLQRPGMENMSRQEMLMAVGPFLAKQGALEAQQEELRAAKARNEYVGDRSTEIAQKDVMLSTMNVVDAHLGPMGKTYDEITKTLGTFNASKSPLDPAQVEELRGKFNSFRMQFLSDAEDRVYSYGLDKTQTERALAPARSFIDRLEYAIVNKDVGALQHINNWLHAYKNGDDLKLMNEPALRTVAAIRRNVGELYGTLLIEGSPALQSATAKAALGDRLMEQFGNNSTESLYETNKQDSEVKKITEPSYYKTKLNSNLRLFTEPGITDEAKVSGAKRLYGPNNQAFIGSIKNSDNIDMKKATYNQMVNEVIFSQIKGLAAKGYPEAVDDYKTWAMESFFVAYGPEIGDLRSMVQGGSVKASINPDSGKIELTPTATSGGKAGSATAMVLAQANASKINSGLSNFKHVLDADNRTVEQYLSLVTGSDKFTQPSKLGGPLIPQSAVDAYVNSLNTPNYMDAFNLPKETIRPTAADEAVVQIKFGESDARGNRQYSAEDATQMEIKDLASVINERIDRIKVMIGNAPNSTMDQVDELDKAIAEVQSLNEQINSLRTLLPIKDSSSTLKGTIE